MSPGLMKMWFSFGAMGAMAISVALIHLSRTKISNKILSFLFATIAYVLLISSFVVMIFLVFNGPQRGGG